MNHGEFRTEKAPKTITHQHAALLRCVGVYGEGRPRTRRTSHPRMTEKFRW